ncbi:hypothetical protein NKH61_30645 [Mesorhizobium sp. M1005]|uniref:hypothetical protein n=1 Tax=unclassified Mesorhizobium TaxID=325217 RepID=UPI00333DC998
MTFDLTCAPASAPSAGAANSNTVVEPMLSIAVIQAQALPINPVVTNDVDGQAIRVKPDVQPHGLELFAIHP